MEIWIIDQFKKDGTYSGAWYTRCPVCFKKIYILGHRDNRYWYTCKKPNCRALAMLDDNPTLRWITEAEDAKLQQRRNARRKQQ